VDLYPADGPGVHDLVCFHLPALTNGPVWGIVQELAQDGSIVVDFGPVRTLVAIAPSDVIEWKRRHSSPGLVSDDHAGGRPRRIARLARLWPGSPGSGR
jgi:hypothetical protein